MSGSAVDSRLPRGAFNTSAISQSSAVPPAQHGSNVADSGALMPALTPATTTRQSVARGVLSSFWGSCNNATVHGQAILPDSSVSTIIAHAHPTDAQELPSDMTASTGSLPSTTTTLTNTLPPTQSAAIRALNAPAFHSSTAKNKPAKSTSSQTSITSQPVVVRTYSGSRHTSRSGSALNPSRTMPTNKQNNMSALSASLMSKSERLPPVEEFSFSAILRAVDPEIRDAIDAIAEICARSKMSLADEYEAHLPPQGEITGAGPGWAAGTGVLTGRARLSRLSQGWTAADNTLMSVPEASSSSEGLVQESMSGTHGSLHRGRSAYGSLQSVIGGGSGTKTAITDDTFRDPQTNSAEEDHPQQQGPAWAVLGSASSSSHPSIALVTTPTASNHLDTSFKSNDKLEGTTGARNRIAAPEKRSLHQRAASAPVLPTSRVRSSALSSITSWLPWPRPSNLTPGTRQELERAEVRLRDVLLTSRSFGKGKAAANAM